MPCATLAQYTHRLPGIATYAEGVTCMEHVAVISLVWFATIVLCAGACLFDAFSIHGSGTGLFILCTG